VKYTTNSARAACVGIAIACLVGCTPTTHVTETTTTREYDTPNPTVTEPVANSNTTTTTQFSNGTVQRTYAQPGTPYSPPPQTTTTVTTDSNDGTVQKQTTTTYQAP
jgi:hypothetical protein